MHKELPSDDVIWILICWYWSFMKKADLCNFRGVFFLGNGIRWPLFFDLYNDSQSLIIIFLHWTQLLEYILQFIDYITGPSLFQPFWFRTFFHIYLSNIFNAPLSGLLGRTYRGRNNKISTGCYNNRHCPIGNREALMVSFVKTLIIFLLKYVYCGQSTIRLHHFTRSH